MHTLFKIFFRVASYYRGLKLYLMILLCGGKCLGIPKVGKNVIFKYPPHKNISIGKDCSIGSNIEFDIPKNAYFSLGDKAKLTNTINIAASKSITIGENALIAEGVSIRDSQHKYSDSNTPINLQGLEQGTIVIGSDVWIGKGSTILLDTNIADGCIIGANSLVKGKILEPNSVYVGIPLRRVKSRR